MNELNLVLTAEIAIADNEMYELIECEPISQLKGLSEKALKSESFKNSIKKKASKDEVVSDESNEDTEGMYQELKAQADEHFAAGQYDQAEKVYNEAANFKPSPFLKGRINECKKRMA